MTLKARTRGWLAAASQAALEDLHLQVEHLSRQLAESRSEAVQAERLRTAEIGALRDAMEVLRDGLDQLRGDLSVQAGRIDGQAEQAVAHAEEIGSLRRQLEQNRDQDSVESEALRTKLAGLTEQWRWDTEDLRKSVAALAERIARPA